MFTGKWNFKITTIKEHILDQMLVEKARLVFVLNREGLNEDITFDRV